MKSVLIKLTSIFLIILIFLTTCVEFNKAYGSEAIHAIYDPGAIDDSGGANESAKKILTSILDVVRIVGAAIAIIILMVIAAKYIMASAGDRADIKKYAINYVVGAVIFFAASGILGLISKTIEETI